MEENSLGTSESHGCVVYIFALYGGSKGSDSLQAMLGGGEVDFTAILRGLLLSHSRFYFVTYHV